MLGLALYILDMLRLSVLMCLYRNTFGYVFGLQDRSESQIGHINASVTVSPNVTFRASSTAAH